MLTHTCLLFSCPSTPLMEWLPPGRKLLSLNEQTVLALCLSDHSADSSAQMAFKLPSVSPLGEPSTEDTRSWLSQLSTPDLSWYSAARLPHHDKSAELTCHFGPGGWFVQILEKPGRHPLLTISGEAGRSLPLPLANGGPVLPLDPAPQGRIPGIRQRIRLRQAGSLHLNLSQQAQLPILALLRSLGLESNAPMFILQHADRAP